MALTFPLNPLNGDSVIQGTVTFIYNTTMDAWIGKDNRPLSLVLPAGNQTTDQLRWNGTAWLPITDTVYDANMNISNDF
jgi:hypothetical protein